MNKWKLTNEWKTVLASVMLSCVVTIAVLQALQGAVPWKFRFLQAETVTIGGGTGQGSIILSAERGLDGMATVTLKGAGSSESLTLSVSSMGFPTIAIDSANGKPLLVLDNLQKNRQPRIRLMDANTGKEAWSVTIDDAGQPLITPP